jgi:signal transduction histidine kinase
VQAIPEGRQGLVEVGLSAESEGVVVHVRDNGTGISAEQETRMFVPNFTTKTGGTGLGLAMVKSLVEGMGGRVWFETQPKQGTAFFVWLPLSSTAS